MGKFTVEKWCCDRCGVVYGKRPSDLGYRYSVSASVDYPQDCAGGPVFSWKEMCNECDAQVSREVNAMRVSADKAKAALKGASND
ncbi:hypothetical protein [Gellertiella hungarica]|uniref:Uncharacterized protein n=1 Tax=Gellertiella hungarica TaxID=1572859 RepID=A0A7W6J8M6_9HYPH|nr:hypothetical protein [Gellertiella hungarica]MBB4066799.1 hypothetical protein [Gellertiella hungarica]